MRFIQAILLCVFFLTSACRKGEKITPDPNARLNFSADSILFDTIFTAIGSSVRKFKIINKNKDALNVSSIQLSGGNQSPFNININGETVNTKNNLIINGQDSVNLFVKVNINPTAQNLPFLVQDSIIFQTNGNKQAIQLLAYGQNAVFLDRASISSNTTWTKALPYVVTNTVTVKNGATLTISPGTKIYFHTDATMLIEGQLTASGTDTEPIQFSGDRLESSYSEAPGQWKGIYFKASGNGLIRFANIKNASVGITSDSLSANGNPKLILSNTIIKNMQVAAYIGYHSELLAFNNLFYNCGNYLIYGVGGGRYNLKQNTFAGINVNFPRKTASLSFSDYLSSSIQNALQTDIRNNIIWGSLNNELDVQKKTNAVSTNTIAYNLIKTTSLNYSTTNNILNADPQFMLPAGGDFQLSGSSPALKKGTDLSTDPFFIGYLNRDLKNKIRIFPSSLGAYEK